MVDQWRCGALAKLYCQRLTRGPATALCNYFRRDALGHECLDHVANLDVGVVGDRDSAFHAVAHFAGIIFEALSELILPLKITTLSRSRRTSESRLIRPSETWHPAIVPTFGNAEGVFYIRTALVSFLMVGSSKPVMARLISSCSS